MNFGKTRNGFGKRLAITAFALIMMIICWETNRTDAAVAETRIPEESIRLRILANSDSAEDQAVKRRIRDAVVAEMNGWVKEPDGIVQARQAVQEHLPEIRQMVGSMLAEKGLEYGFSAELAVVPFPTKMYGSRVYPAGDYEALRITLGTGLGQNWWCVLFPPLCFVDAVSGEAVAAESDGGVQAERTGSAANAAGASNPSGTLRIESKKQVHFYFWDKGKELAARMHGWFG